VGQRGGGGGRGQQGEGAEGRKGEGTEGRGRGHKRRELGGAEGTKAEGGDPSVRRPEQSQQAAEGSFYTWQCTGQVHKASLPRKIAAGMFIRVPPTEQRLRIT